MNGAVIPQFPGQTVPLATEGMRKMMPSRIRLGSARLRPVDFAGSISSMTVESSPRDHRGLPR